MRMPWRASFLAHLLGLHSPSALCLGRCWCQRRRVVWSCSADPGWYWIWPRQLVESRYVLLLKLWRFEVGFRRRG